MCCAERKVKDMSKPILMQFPLKGEWYSPNTPGSKIPSHGTNRYGTRYAYDFIQVDWTRKGWPAYRVSMMQYLIKGAALEDYYCWGERVYAPCDGMVVVAEDGYAEKKTNLLTDVFKAYKNANYFDPYKDNIQCIAGNYMIIQYAKNVYANKASKYMNIDITRGLKEIDNSLYIVEGEAENNGEAIVEAYQNVNPSVEVATLKETKHFPHVEVPEQFLEQVGIFF